MTECYCSIVYRVHWGDVPGNKMTATIRVRKASKRVLIVPLQMFKLKIYKRIIILDVAVHMQ